MLDRPAQFYQRRLSIKSEELLDPATKYIADHSLEDFHDLVFVPALLLAEKDRPNGVPAEGRERFMLKSGRELIDELERLDQAANLSHKLQLAPADRVVTKLAAVLTQLERMTHPQPATDDLPFPTATA